MRRRLRDVEEGGQHDETPYRPASFQESGRDEGRGLRPSCDRQGGSGQHPRQRRQGHHDRQESRERALAYVRMGRLRIQRQPRDIDVWSQGSSPASVHGEEPGQVHHLRRKGSCEGNRLLRHQVRQRSARQAERLGQALRLGRRQQQQGHLQRSASDLQAGRVLLPPRRGRPQGLDIRRREVPLRGGHPRLHGQRACLQGQVRRDRGICERRCREVHQRNRHAD